jgi:hypothetical protein
VDFIERELLEQTGAATEEAEERADETNAEEFDDETQEHCAGTVIERHFHPCSTMHVVEHPSPSWGAQTPAAAADEPPEREDGRQSALVLHARPEPLQWYPLSHCSFPFIFPSPQMGVHMLASPVHVNPASTRHVAVQPSPETVFLSSQASDLRMSPSPQIALQMLGAPVQVKPASIAQEALQPSPDTVFLSSHCSRSLATFPSPHTGTGQVVILHIQPGFWQLEAPIPQ